MTLIDENCTIYIILSTPNKYRYGYYCNNLYTILLPLYFNLKNLTKYFMTKTSTILVFIGIIYLVCNNTNY